MPGIKPKKTIKEIVQEAKRQQKLPELIEGLKQNIEKTKMSKEEIREKFNEIPKEKVEEYRETAKEIGIESTPENIVALYAQENLHISEKSEEPKEEFVEKARKIFEESKISPTEEVLETAALLLQKYEEIPEAAEDIVSEELGLSTFYTLKAVEFIPNIKDPTTVTSITEGLVSIALNTKNEKAILVAINCISKYRETADSAVIAQVLGDIASYTKSGEAVSNAAICISKYEKYQKATERIAKKIGQIASETKSESAISDVVNLFSSETISNCISKYEKTPEVAKEIALLFLTMNSLEEVEYFAKNSEKILEDLNRRFNIEYFGRYPYSVIKDMIDNKREGSLAILCYAKWDYNQSFYIIDNYISKLSEHYNVKIFEAGKTSDITRFLKELKKEYGLADLFILGGHGDPTSISIGVSGTWGEMKLDAYSDADVMDAICQTIKNGSTIILDSCSTGRLDTTRSISNYIASQTRAAAIFAPTGPTVIDKIDIKIVDGKPKIEDVLYVKTETARHSGSKLKK